ncbi:uncharacterized protein LOC143917375 [Arctopsyche grandis]|uniref:uncharacterized protein LOC143917375 n=1 Tax=Arctopsyche grandis TaxID=121162 RepID=UPI00406D8958
MYMPIYCNNKMIVFKSLSVLTLLAVVTFVHSETVVATEENSKSDEQYTIITLGYSILKKSMRLIAAYDPEKDLWINFGKINLHPNKYSSPFLSNGKIIFFGGSTGSDAYTNEVIAFDLTKKTSSNLAPMLQKRNNAQMAEIDGYIYVTGGRGEGYEVLDTVERYDPQTNSWTFMAPMLEKRYNHAINVWEGKIYVAGGINMIMHDYTNSLEIYDPKTNSWTFGTPMPTNRSDFSIVFADGSLFAMGGVRSSRDGPQGERLNLKTQEWSNLTNTDNDPKWRRAIVFGEDIFIFSAPNLKMNTKTNELTKMNFWYSSADSSIPFLVKKSLVNLGPKKQKIKDPVSIVAVGPGDNASNNCTVQLYDPLDDTWTTVAEVNLNVSTEYSTIISLGKIYFFGGTTNNDEMSDEVTSFDLATKEIKKLTPMWQKKKNVGVATIGQYIYITGGIDENFDLIDTVERYDTKTDSWSGMAPMLSKRSHHAINEYEGKIYVAGGFGGAIYKDPLKSLEIYDPNLNKWNLGTPMIHARTTFAIVFVDGSLFAIGGLRIVDHLFGERFDLNTKQWKDFRKNVEDTSWNSAVVLDDMIYMNCNGLNNYQYNTKTNELVELKTNSPSSPNFLLWTTS